MYAHLIYLLFYLYFLQVASTETNLHSIHVYDVINPRNGDLESYKRCISNEESYESNNPELYQPDRILFVDGILQSSFHGHESYHESLVHPGMFSHSDPSDVAIIGGSMGATLREVLKHKDVESVDLFEVDEAAVKFYRENIPSWNDCSDLMGSTASCFDDPRVHIYYDNPLSWFTDKNDSDYGYDVIIMDQV